MSKVLDQENHSEAAAPKFRLSRIDKVIAVILLLGLISLFLWPFVVFVVKPGEVGVLYRLFTTGTVTTFVYPEGIGFKWPWNRIYIYNIRTQAREYDVHALARDGLTINVATTVLFHPRKNEVGLLHKTVGPEYPDILVRPLAIEAIRDTIGKLSPHAIYRLDIHGLEQHVLKELKVGPSSKLIDYHRVMFRDVELPDKLNSAITNKLTQEQRADAYQYILIQQKREAERKRIEAIGIQTFYSIIADALTPQLLTWRGIEATVELAKSNNAKVVIVGSGKDQLPLILGSDIAKQPDLAKPPAVKPEQHELPDLENLPKLFPDIGAKRPPIKEGGGKWPWSSLLKKGGKGAAAENAGHPQAGSNK